MGLPPQPTSLPVLGISAFYSENVGIPRYPEPETELERPGMGVFGPAEEELSLAANWRFGMGLAMWLRQTRGSASEQPSRLADRHSE